MAGFVAGIDCGQMTFFSAGLDDYVVTDNPVRAVDVFVDKLSFIRARPPNMGRPVYEPRMEL